MKYPVDRFACSITPTRGLLCPMSIVVGNVPLEISKYYYHFIWHGGEIEGKVADIRPRISSIPSGGQEVKLNLNYAHDEAVSPKLVFMGLHWGAGDSPARR